MTGETTESGPVVYLDPTVDPYLYRKDVRYHGRPIYHTILESDEWFEHYVDLIEGVRQPRPIGPVLVAG